MAAHCWQFLSVSAAASTVRKLKRFLVCRSLDLLRASADTNSHSDIDAYEAKCLSDEHLQPSLRKSTESLLVNNCLDLV